MARFIGLIALLHAAEAQVFLGQQEVQSAKCDGIETAFEKHQKAATECGGSAACFCGENGALVGLSYARLGCGLGSDADTEKQKAALQSCKKCAGVQAAFAEHQLAATKCGGSAAAPNPCFCGESGALLGLSYARLGCGLGSDADIDQSKAALQACKVSHGGFEAILLGSQNEVVAAPLELSEEIAENTSQNPYMHSNNTADALAFIFISVAIVICWIECCGAGKK